MSEHSSTKIAAPQTSTATASSRPVSKPSITPARTALLQRACACGELPGSGGKCDECDKKNKKNTLQRASNGGPQPASIPPSVNQTLGSPGRPLDNSTRSFMESRFGHDFSSVRVHNDALAAESARAVNARAYTVGQHIAFDQGQYAPHTESGKHLLAHELAHTIQQQGIQRFSNEPTASHSPEYARLEQEAGTTADAVMRGGSISLPRLTSGPQVQRVPWSEMLEEKKCPGGANIDPRINALTDPQTGKPPKDVKDVRVYTIAEERIVDYYIQQHSSNLIATGGISKGGGGRKLLEDLDSKDPMVKKLHKEFHSGEKTRFLKDKSVPDADFAVEEDDESALSQIEGSKAAKATGELMYKRPDIMDITTRRVFDVTTVGQTPGKVKKIENVYVAGLNDITNKAGISGPAWKAGSDKDFAPPPKFILVHRYDGTKVICYGPTDLATNPGVLSYVALDLSGSGEQAAIETEPYEIKMGALQATLQVPKGAVAKKGDTVAISETDPAARMLPGFILVKLNRKASGDDIIEAAIEAAGDSKDPKVIPIEIQGNKEVVQFSVNKKTRKLTQKKAKKTSIPFEYKPMSKGAITELSISETGGLAGKGYIKPSIPFLKQLDVTFEPGKMFIGKALGPNDLKEPFPGVRVVEASLGLQLAPVFKPEGKVVFEFGPEGKPPLADATLSVSTDGIGLVAAGDLRVFIPGVDKAEAKVIYKGGGEHGAGSWSGTITIESSQIKLPYIESGSLIVQLVPGKGVDVDGKLNLNLPGENTATVGLKRTEKAWLLSGAGKFKVPKVGPVTVIVVYNTSTQHLSVEAKDVEFKIFGVTANLKTLKGGVQPGHKPVFEGSGSVELKKGKVDGRADLTLNKNGKFTGKGTVKYKFNENLTASASVELDDKERLKFSGEIVIASIPLFDKFGDEKELFSVDISIPIPGASIGGVGLEARIGGGAKMGYSIGPGTVAPLKFEAGFYPLEEQTDLNLGVSGSLNIPASAFLEANVHADIVLDAFVAEIGGGVKVTGTIILQGGLFAPFSATFKQGKIEAELTPELKFALLLGLALSIRAWAKAGVGWLSVKTEKEWTLARREINTGLGFSIIAPFKYSSDTGPKLPSLSDIKFKKPEITRDKMMSILDQLVSGASEKEV